VAAALVVMCSGGVNADEEYRAWPGEFMRMGAGARAMAMGNAYTAVEGDLYASYFNPAGLAAMVEPQLALSMKYLSMDRKFMHLAYGKRIGPDADFALSWIQAGTDEIIGRDLNGNPTGALEDKRNAMSVTFAKAVSSWLSLGVNTKLSLWKLGGENAKAYGFDVGAMLSPFKMLSLSFVMRDINSRYTWKTERWNSFIHGADGQPLEKKDKFPVYYTAGCAYKTRGDKLILSATVESVQDNPLGFDLGGSYSYNDRFSVRAGMYNYTLEDGLETGSLTFGFSLNITESVGFDYAYVPDDFEGESIHVAGILVSYGE